MDRRQFVWGLALMTMSLPLVASEADAICPICQGQLANSANLKDDLSRPSRNLEVWSRTVDCLVVGEQGGQICTRCWYVFREGTWTRSSERPDDFHHPLTYAISAFPMPEKKRIQGRAIYQQRLMGADGRAGIIEEVRFWTFKTNVYLATIRRHAKVHDIHLVMEEYESAPGDIYVVAKIDTRPKSSWAESE